MGELQIAVKQQQEVIAELVSRLAPVLAAPNTGADPGNPLESLPQLPGAIRDCRVDVESNTAALRQVLSNLEL